MRWLFLALVITLYAIYGVYGSNLARFAAASLTLGFIINKYRTKVVKWKEQ